MNDRRLMVVMLFIWILGTVGWYMAAIWFLWFWRHLPTLTVHCR